MVFACDTSFLFSLYGSDANSANAVEWVAQNANATRFLTMDTNQKTFAVAEGLIFPTHGSDTLKPQILSTRAIGSNTPPFERCDAVANRPGASGDRR